MEFFWGATRVELAPRGLTLTVPFATDEAETSVLFPGLFEAELLSRLQVAPTETTVRSADSPRGTHHVVLRFEAEALDQLNAKLVRHEIETVAHDAARRSVAAAVKAQQLQQNLADRGT